MGEFILTVLGVVAVLVLWPIWAPVLSWVIQMVLGVIVITVMFVFETVAWVFGGKRNG